jgi:hypothetical protein
LGNSKKSLHDELTSTDERHFANACHSHQGTTIEYDNKDRAKASLSSMGWTAKRGESLPPVWVVVHKV